MRLNKTEQEEVRKRVKILIPKMEKSEIVNHFQKEGYHRKTKQNYYKDLHVAWFCTMKNILLMMAKTCKVLDE